MRSTILVAAVAAVSTASAFSGAIEARQYEGCEAVCNPMRGWALTCRTDAVTCQNQCTAELLEVTDNCYECIKEKNPDKAPSIAQYIAMAHKMCGSELPASSSGASESAAPSATSAGASGASAAPTASESAKASASSAAPAASSSGAAAATTAKSSAGKFGISLGAVALAVSALLL